MCDEFSFTIRVYIEDTDAGGIVYYVNYLKFMERARTELLRTLGINKPATLEEGNLLVVASVNVKYLKSALLDDELQVTAKILKLARSYFLIEQKVMRGEECLAGGEIKVACVDQETMKPCVFPKRIQGLLGQAPI
ncbi:MAG: tol-pal system-associated acyl-CoA thioesterase [Agarilytica sp.]